VTPRKPTRAKALGVTDAEYARLLEAQGGHCALCPNTPKTRRLHVDHDHATGKVRGLLCHRCNRALPTWVSGERDAMILRARRHGWTYARIAAQYGVTRQRAWQIVTKAGKA
jgi:hypothetical protein